MKQQENIKCVNKISLLEKRLLLLDLAPAIHPVIHLQIIPDAANTVWGRRLISPPGWDEMRECLMLYLLMLLEPPLFILLIYLEGRAERWTSLRWQGLSDNINSRTEYTHTVWGELLTETEFLIEPDRSGSNTCCACLLCLCLKYSSL